MSSKEKALAYYHRKVAVLAALAPAELAAYREHNRQRAQAWRERNRERHRALSMAWERAHPEHVRAKKRQWMRDHAGQRKLKAADYYQRKKEEILRKTDAYRKAHPEMNAAMQRKRRATRNGAPANDFTAQQWLSMKAHYQHCCVYCGKKQQRLTQDHIVPLSKGGSHTYSNIVPACRSCNSKKGTGDPLCPIQPLLCL